MFELFGVYILNNTNNYHHSNSIMIRIRSSHSNFTKQDTKLTLKLHKAESKAHTQNSQSRIQRQSSRSNFTKQNPKFTLKTHKAESKGKAHAQTSQSRIQSLHSKPQSRIQRQSSHPKFTKKNPILDSTCMDSATC